MKSRGFKPIHLDMLKSETEKDWKTVIREEINRYRAAHSKSAKKHGLSADYELELSGALEKRRVKALMNSLPEVSKEHPKAVNDWIVLNIVSESYASIEERDNLMLAAAIWILDQIDKTNIQRYDLYKLLPTNEEAIDIWDYPDIWDCRFTDTLIFSVESVLRHRNKDVAPPESDGKDSIRMWTSTLAANGVIHSETESRQNFEKLIGLIPPEKIYVAVQHFKQFFNLWKERYFACIAPLCSEAERVRENVNSIRRKINEAEDKAADVVKKADNNRKNLLSQKKSPLKAPFVPSITDFPMSFNMDSQRLLHNPLGDILTDDVMSVLSRLDELNDSHEEALNTYNAVMGKKFSFSATLNRRGSIPAVHCEQAFGKAVSANMEILPISDPYELCFALLYLLEQDSDLPWLYGACIGLMEEVAACLPWNYYHYEEDEDDIWNGTAPIVKKPVSIPNWYERKYFNKNNDIEYDYPLNLAQLVYEETGCLMPRDLHIYDSKYKRLGMYGIQRNNAVTLLYCMEIMGMARRQLNSMNFDQSYMEFMSEDKQVKDTKKDKEISREELQEQISSLRNEVQRLRSALHTSEKKAADAQKKLTEEKKEFELERRELADLREYIFLQDKSDEQEDDVPDTDMFPYEVKKDTVVFGGHFTWVKVFKPLFKGNIRFVEAGAYNFDPVIIRNCEVVWIQNNAIPHSQYYKVVNTARQYRKPVRYFRYASAIKSAMQLVESDNEE